MGVNADNVVIDVEARLTNLDRNLVEGKRKIDRFASDVDARIKTLNEGFARAGKTGDATLFASMKAQASEVIRGRTSQTDAEVNKLVLAERQATAELAKYEARLVSVNREEAKGAAIRRSSGGLGGPPGPGGPGARNVLASSASAAGLQSIGLRYGAIGLAATAAFQAVGAVADGLDVTGDAAATFEGKARNATAALIKLDAVGVVMALDKQKEATSWQQAKQQLDSYTRGTGEASFGITRAIDKIDLLVGYDRKLDRLTSSFDKLWAAAHPPTTIDFGQIAGGTFGITQLDPALGKGDPTAGLTQRLKTALAGAEAVGGKSDQLGQLRRASTALNAQLKQPGLTDTDREAIYNDISSINSSIAALLKVKKPAAVKEAPIVPLGLEIGLEQATLTKAIGDDLDRLHAIDDYLVKKIAHETDENQKLQELQRLGEVRSQLAALTQKQDAVTISDLFQGPTLTSKPFQFAEQFGFKPDAQTLLKDIKGQVAAADRFQADLARLKRKGASDNLISNLAGQGAADAGDEAHTLAGADRGLVKRFSGAFSAREKQQQQIASLVAHVRSATVNIEHATIGGRSNYVAGEKFSAAGLSGAR